MGYIFIFCLRRRWGSGGIRFIWRRGVRVEFSCKVGFVFGFRRIYSC